MQRVDLPGADNISVVWHAGPVVQFSSVGEFLDLELAFLGQVDGHQLGLGEVEVLLVVNITGDPGCIGGQHKQRVILNAQGSNMVATLIAEAGLVLVLKTERTS
jgi:hypothetical protein